MIIIKTNHFEKSVFLEALQETSKHRDSQEIVLNVDIIMNNIKHSNELLNLWKNYQKSFSYASDIEFKDIVMTIHDFLK